ncbi:hypothetical protein KFE98_20020 [bacterium SCSIO 12741]|nr:hypothetical protein KFE98_20020 [bacterium SCSIO 12741]
MHALALSTYGNSHNKIRKTQAWYGPWWNRLNLRWTGELDNYSLEIKTRCNYGANRLIQYNVTKIWDDSDNQTVATPIKKKANESAK